MDPYSTERDLWWFSLSSASNGGVRVIALQGRVGAAAARPLADALADAVTEERRLVVDLAALNYISSSGIDAIERGAKEARGRGGILVLCALQDPVRIAFELSGALSEMAVEPSLEAARARALR